MAGEVASLFVKLGLDATEFQKGIDAAGKTTDGLGAKTKTLQGIGSTAFKGLGVAASAGFALATKGALEAQSAQGDFMAATGASRDEAKLFVSSMDGLAGSAGAVGLSFESIASTGQMVEQQFGTTGQQTADLTENVLEFAKVTKQDATGAAADLEDTLSAYGMSADDAAGFMDKLVASNQKFGTDVGPEALGVIRDLAPALTAAGGSADDAVGFLNAFETAGQDAGAAAKGLRTAVSNLKPGQSIDDLIAQVGAIEDPLQRAKKATELFGKGAGQKFAEVIQPGMTSLDDFKVSAEDASGAVHQGAEDMLTDADRIRGIFDKLGAGARELGQTFGPALMGISSLGSLAAPFAKSGIDLIKKLGAAILPQATATGVATGAAMAEGEAEGAGGVNAIKSIGSRIAAMSVPLAAEGTTVGTAIGSAMSGAALIAFASVAAAPLQTPVWIAKLTGTDYDSQMQGVGKFWADSTLTGVSDELKQGAGAAFTTAFNEAKASGASNDAAAQAGAAAGAAFLSSASDELRDHTADDLREGMAQSGVATIFANDQALTAAGIQLGDTVSSSASDSLASGMADVVATGSSAFEQHWHSDALPVFTSSGPQAMRVLTQGLMQSLPDAHQVWKDYVSGVKNTLDPMKEMTWLEGKLSSEKLAKGLESKNPFVREKAQLTRDTLQGQLDDLHKLGYDDGTDLGKGVASGVDSQTDDVGSEASDYQDQVDKLPWHQWGVNVGTEYGQGVAAGINGVNFTGKIDHLLDLLKGFSPPKKGPIRDAVLSAVHVGEAYGNLLIDGAVSSVARRVGEIRGALMPDLSAPALSSIGHSALAGAGAAGLTVNGGIHITVNGGATNDKTASAVEQAVMAALDKVLDAANPRIRFTARAAA